MKKTAIIILTILLLISTVQAQKECKPTQEQTELPCQIITSYTPTNPCNTYTAKVYNSTPTQIQELTLTNYGSTGFCNTTFNITTRGSYFVNVTNGDTASIFVEGYKMEYLGAIIFTIFTALGLGITLIMYKKKAEKDAGSTIIMGVISSTIFLITAYMIITGFEVFPTSVFQGVINPNNAITIILLGLGVFNMLYSSSFYKHQKNENQVIEEYA